jgi:peptidyl-prolyl cis-trans isomerase D
MAISVERFRSTEAIAQDEIEDYYATYQDAFQRQEQVRVRHILVKVAQDASEAQEAEVRAKAENILTELRGGADFTVLAKAHSEDTATTEKGGDLGFFPRGQMVKPFEQVAFTLPVGQLSNLVRTPFGYHILRVEDKIEPEIKPLLEVRQEVIAKLREEKARDAAIAFVDDLIVILEDDPGQFASLATQHGLSVVTTPFVAATGRIADLENVSDMVRRAFALVGQAVDTVEGTDGAHYIFQVAEVQPSTIPEFAAVSKRVENDLRRQKSGDLARQTADDWAAQVQAGKSLSALATPLQVQVGETKAFSRNDPVPQLGRSATFNQIAFGLQPGETGAVHEGVRHFVIQVMTRRGADMSTYDAEKVAYREQLLRRKRHQTILAFQNSLQAQYQKLRQQGEIVVNPQYVF